MAWTPKVTKSVVDGEVQSLAVGHPLVDEYLAFLGARVRLNSWLAAAYDLKVFFCVVVKEPADVRKVDIFSFIADQRRSPARFQSGASGGWGIRTGGAHDQAATVRNRRQSSLSTRASTWARSRSCSSRTVRTGAGS